jgi:ABC-2 type transport system permease protein
VILTTVLAAIAFASVAITARLVDLGVGLASMWWATVSCLALTWAVAAIAFALGASTGRRGSAITAAAAVGVISYLITSLAEAGIGFFRALRPVSLFTHYDVAEVLFQGAPSWRLGVLLTIAVVGMVVALGGIDRRDLRAG